jgi:RNA polymerase sigma factor (sigma-70 family)
MNTPANVVLRHLRGFVTEQSPDRQLLECFAVRREEAAFETLVKRHGPLVLGVCRRVLHNGPDAEDAFQATFLALARQAESAGRCGSVGGWLYRVAYRTAVKSRARAASRRLQELQGEPPVSEDPLAAVTGRELLTTLDEELQRLPEIYQVPLVLCYLEGKTADEAARQLDWAVRTLKRRLRQARERLRIRLTRRGLSLSAALLTAGVVQEATAAVPVSLAASTVRAALGALTLSACSSLRTAALILGGCVLMLGTVALVRPEPRRVQTPQGEAKAPSTPAEQMTVSGQVMGTDGKPAGGASIVLVGRARRQYRTGDLLADRSELLGEGQSDAEGRFRFKAHRTSSARFLEVYAIATAKGHAIGWQRIAPDAEEPHAVFKLLPEQLLRGRLVDLQGQPAAGIRVSLSRLGNVVNGEYDGISLSMVPGLKGFWPKPVTTDAKGYFEIGGCNRSQGVSFSTEGERFGGGSFGFRPVGEPRKESTVLGLDSGGFVHVQKTGPDEKGQPEVPTFTLTPNQVLEGKVVYADTGKPAAGALVQGVRTNVDGRFQMPLGRTGAVTLEVVPAEGEPYLPIFHRVEWPKGAVKHQVEIRLPRGVLVSGKVTEAASGKPVAGACVQFWPRNVDDPARPRNLLTGWMRRELTRDDGTFQIALPSGTGHLMVQGPTPEYIRQEIGSEVLNFGRPGGSRNYPDAAMKIEVPASGEIKDVAITLRRGVTVRGKLLGPGGEPVALAIMLHRSYVSHDMGWHFATQARGGVFEVHGLDPEGTLAVYFLDAQNQCGAVVRLSGKDAGKELTVRLAPCGKATARYVDGKGKPLAGFQPSPEIVVTPTSGGLLADRGSLVNLDRHNYWDRLKTDANGRITFPALIPGATYQVERFEKNNYWVLHKEFTVESGKTVDLGEVVIDQSK